jgi:Protein of unknown function (DUF1592)/Protein of unknown function (DUF1588)/Protein of unknown function (DUF1585)/Protein of unknown function (DUF1587)/Protein of unknown function (DUF1595)
VFRNMQRKSVNRLVGVFLVLTAGVSLLSLKSAESASDGPAALTATDMQQLTNSYCLSCHNDALATSGLSLQQIDFNRVGDHPEILEKVVKKLRAHMMPPSGMPRPPFETYQAMTGWLESELDKVWFEDINPGQITPIHRMNRYEYNNAINALLGIDVEVMSLLPGDPTADGSFDNIAASLPFSASHLERYMSVARQVTRLAIGVPPLGPVTTSYEVPLFMNQDSRQSEDMPFGSRGGISVAHNFPVNGKYNIRVQLERNYQDYIKGLGRPQQLEVRLDGRLLERFTVGGEAPGTPAPLSFSGTGEPGSIDWEQYMITEADRGLQLTAAVPAGPGLLTVSYIRDRFEQEEIPQPIQGGRLYANDEAYLGNQKIQMLEISGPMSQLAAVNAEPSPSRQKIFSCYPEQQSQERACAEQIFQTLARQAYRRPVTGDDIDLLLGFFNQGREQGQTFDAGVQLALEYLLSDPEFLIRSYKSSAGTSPGELYALSDLELASRLSYFLWSAPPDAELLSLAEAGELGDSDVFRAQALRLLSDPRGVDTLVADFASQWLNLRRLSEVQINTVIFPDYDLSLIEAFREETQQFIAHTLEADTSIMELLSADYSYMNERLARHYGIEGIYGSRFRRASFPDSQQRGGLLAHGSLLTVTSYPGRTSPVLRGKWLLDNMLGTPPPPPPANVPILPDAESGEAPKSIRERLARHREDPICSTCHTVIDPLGFALENFDVIGGWREFDETGNAVDPNGNYPGGVEFAGFADLRDWMLGRPDQFAHTVTEKLMTYALGRRVEYYDQPIIRQIVRNAAVADYNWSSLVLGIVESPQFQMSRLNSAPMGNVNAAVSQ